MPAFLMVLKARPCVGIMVVICQSSQKYQFTSCASEDVKNCSENVRYDNSQMHHYSEHIKIQQRQQTC